MLHPNALNKSKPLCIYLLSSAFCLLSPLASLAHNVKISSNVAATFHIDPNDNPRAGEKAQAWFVLTKQGGERISLESCDCHLAVYPSQAKEGDSPVLQPALTSIAIEQHQDAPSAEVVFPKAGIYRLELVGKPKDGVSFQPFELSYEVTVQGKPATPAIAPSAQLDRQAPNFNLTALLPVGGLVFLGSALWFLKRK